MKFIKDKKFIRPKWDYFLIFLSFIIIFSTLVYYFYSLNFTGIILSLLLSLISLFFIDKFNLISKHEVIKEENKKIEKNEKIIIIGFFVFLIASFLEVLNAQTVKSLISPWEVINKSFFLFYILSLSLLVLLIYKNTLKSKYITPLISLFLFLSFSIATLVYKIGYGFDPFIHQAAMDTIASKGVILPKTPYYIGQYGLLVTINKIFGINLYFLHKLLVPILVSIIIPFGSLRLLKYINLRNKRSEFTNLLTLLFFSSLTFSLFIVTTPQNLSYLFLFLAIVYGLSKKSITSTIALSLATAAIHPISGIPAIIWSAWLLFKNRENKIKEKVKKIISATILSAGSLLIPLALFISSGAKSINIKLSWQDIINPIKNLFELKSAGSESIILNLVYFIYYQYQFIILILFITGIFILYKKEVIDNELKHYWRGILSISLSLFFAFILSSQISFPNLINYEQSSFSQRILNIIIIFLSPFLLISINWLTRKIIDIKNLTIKIIWLIIFLIFITSSLYLAYPRFDKYHNSRGYSTGRLDMQAVELVDEISTDEYIVLANQQISAAALKTFGFNNYLINNEQQIYFYPIPTGGKLYQYYLDMVYKNPNRNTMLEAMDFAGVKESYLIINKYWHDSGKIIKAAKISADNYQVLGDDDVYIFQYLYNN